MFKDLQGLDKKGKKKKVEEEKVNEEGLTESERTESINYYKDPREDYPDLIKNVTTDKICNNFLDAIEWGQYGFRWVCNNGGDKCQYKHCLPEGYIFEQKVQTHPLEREEGQEQTIEDWIEQERAKLPNEGLTPVTFESFQEWKKKKEAEKEKLIEEKRKAEVKKKGGKGLGVLSGRALFKYDPTLFRDDDAAAEVNDYEDEEVKKEMTQEEAEAEAKTLAEAKNWEAKE